MAFGRIIYVDIGKPGQPGVRIQDVKIDFEIEKNLYSAANKGNISIYNLSNATAKKISEVHNQIVVYAGYEDEGGAAPIFYGNITNVKTENEYPESVTKIEALDGIKNIKSKKVSLSYSPGINAGIIIDELVLRSGFPLAQRPPITEIFQNGFAYVGTIKYALDIIVKKKLGLTWSIQNEQIFILGEEEEKIGQIFSFNENTGLIEKPSPVQKQDGKTNKNKILRWEIKTLLYNRLTCGSIVSVQSEEFTGNLKIEKIKMIGSNFENDFVAEIQGLKK